jgi:Na+-translocating ferredoxin:NAD+ oxidoreductase RnfC subunit
MEVAATNLLENIFNAGVVGAGGAGFPTHVKLDCKVEYLLVNAAECEPLLATDKHIMNVHADGVIEGIRFIAEHVSARESYIAVKRVNERETQSLKDAILRAGADIKIFPLDNYYPAGDEQMIVFDITGKTVPPAGIPLERGVVVSNVATVLCVRDAVHGLPVTHKFLTVTGEVRYPKVLRVPVGTSFKACIDACGGSKLAKFKIIDGGPMMGAVSDCTDIGEKYVTKTTSGIIVIPGSGNFIARLHELAMPKMLNRAKSACIQCTFCSDLCPRRLAGHKIRPHMVMRQMASMNFSERMSENDVLEEALICSECGVCETYACPMGLSPRQVNKYVKKQLAGIRYTRPDMPLTPHPMREYRKIAPPRIMARMGLSNLYENKARDFADVTPETVRIPVKQHIGIPANPTVRKGDYVTRGQLIAESAGKVSANIHASIDGVVTETGNFIEINAAESPIGG